MKNIKKYNTDFNERYIAFQTDVAREFNEKRKYFKLLGYKILKYCLTNDGYFKFIAVLKKKSLVECLLIEKKISKNDRVRPPRTTNLYICEYYKDGICLCTDHDFCLYQNTEKHQAVLTQMVDSYTNSKFRRDDDSTMFEDTSLGRIFSDDYSHLNTDDISRIVFHRHNGN